jgi:hypothetical protein
VGPLTSIHLLTRLGSIRPVRITDKRKALGPPRLPVLGQKDPRNMSVFAEHVPQILLLCELAHVGDTQRSTIIAIELATHLLARAASATQMGRHVSAAAGTETTSRAGRVVGHVCGRDVALGSHGVFEGTLCCEMVALADTALDFCILELSLLLRLVALVFVTRFPCRDGAEQDVLCDRHGVGLWACGFALFLAELGPLLALCDAGVYGGFDDGFLDAAGGFDAAAFVVDAVGCNSLGAVFVLGYGVLGEGELCAFVFFFGPVGAAVGLGVSERSCETEDLEVLFEGCGGDAGRGAECLPCWS